MVSEKLLSKIEDYLLGKMSYAEKQAFESEIENDPVLAYEVSLQKAIIRSVKKLEIEKQGNIHPLYQERRLTKYILSIAAIALIFFLVRTIFPEGINHEEAVTMSANDSIPPYLRMIQENSYEPFLPLSSDDSFNLTLEKESQKLFDSGNYGELAKILESMSKRSLKEEFYFGLAQFYLNEFDKAIPLFLIIVEDEKGTSEIIAFSRWYLALSYLNNSQYEKAIELLEIINGTPNHVKQANAKSLLEVLTSPPN